MKSHKKYLSLLAILLINLLITSPVFASFSGVLPVANLGTTPTAAIVTLSSYALTAGQTATVTFTFPAAPISFTSSDITVSNGVLSGLAVTGDPKIYTATFTPTSYTVASTNTITVSPKVTMTNYSVPGNPESIAFDGTNMWTANYGGGSVSKITASGTVTTYGGLGGSPSGVAFDGTNIWVSNYGGNSVSKITSVGATSTFAVSGGPNDIAYDGAGHMWTVNYGGNSMSEISSTGTVMHTYSIGANPYGIAFDGTNMWATNMTDSTVSKVTPTGTTTTYSVGWNPARIAFDGTNMWTANDIGSSVTKITPTGTTTEYSVSGYPYGIAFDSNGYMWTANYGGNSVSKISSTGTVLSYDGTGYLSNPHSIAFDGANMWVANYGGNSVTKVGFSDTGVSLNYSIDTTFAPTLTVTSASSISTTSATLNGNITSTGGIDSSVHGFNYGTTSAYGSTVSVGGALGVSAFTYDIAGLTCNTEYHFQSYATNGTGTGTSTDSSFITSACPVIRHGRSSVSNLVVPQSNDKLHPLDFAINNGDSKTTSSTVKLSFNADSSTVKEYKVSLSPDFIGSESKPYSNGLVDTFELPNTATTNTIYLQYLSTTGNRSPVISHNVVYTPNIPIVSKNIFKRSLQLGSSGSDVTLLQKFLVTDGDLVLSINDSYGRFGKLTKAAVEKFQTKYGIAKYGTPGFGMFGPKSQAKANKILEQQ
jgi:hypothetical protein